MVHSQSLSHMSERSHGTATSFNQNEYSELKDITNELGKKMQYMQKTMDDMQISINEKEAEIIRLNLCLGDEKKRNFDQQQSTKSIYNPDNSTPKRTRSNNRLSYQQHNNSGSEYYNKNIMTTVGDSPYF